jgi:protein-S-isoprenylcysteine O-methyltransferase Ste14
LERLFVWTGGALFAGSIALCVGWYLFYLGEPRPRTGFAPFVYDAVLVTLFASHHSVFARGWVKRQLTPIPWHLRRSFFVWIASLLLIAVCLLWRTLGGELYRATGARAAAHLVVQLAGFALAVWSVAEIDPLELAGIKTPDEPETLQVKGPYRLVRHPLYLGWIVAAFGTHHLTGDRLAFAALTSLYLVIAIPWEERSLVESYGDEYIRYQRQVRWRVIPFVY